MPLLGRAQEAALPVGIQAELLAKVAAYDRNFLPRAGERAKILLLVKPGNSDSSRAGAQMQAALARLPEIAGIPHDETIVPYPGGPELAKLCAQEHPAIVFVGLGFRDDLDAIRTALDGVDVLTATGIPDYVPAGIVLGFDLVASRPKLLVNLTQARKQHVDLGSGVLKLMKVYE